MVKKKHISYEEKKLLLKHHFQNHIELEKLSNEFGIKIGTIYNWLRKINYDYANIERLSRKGLRKERKSHRNS